jgi:hypothetical protein
VSIDRYVFADNILSIYSTDAIETVTTAGYLNELRDVVVFNSSRPKITQDETGLEFTETRVLLEEDQLVRIFIEKDVHNLIITDLLPDVLTKRFQDSTLTKEISELQTGIGITPSPSVFSISIPDDSLTYFMAPFPYEGDAYQIVSDDDTEPLWDAGTWIDGAVPSQSGSIAVPDLAGYSVSETKYLGTRNGTTVTQGEAAADDSRNDGNGGITIKANDSSTTGLTTTIKEWGLETTSDAEDLQVAGALDSLLGIVGVGDIVHVRTVDGSGDTVTDWSFRVLTATSSVTIEVIQEVGLMQFDTAGNLLVSQGTFLTGERYPSTAAAVSDIDGTDGSSSVTLTFASTDYDNGDSITLSATDSDPSIDGEYTITKTSATEGVITISGTTWTSDGTTASAVFSHLSRGYFDSADFSDYFIWAHGDGDVTVATGECKLVSIICNTQLSGATVILDGTSAAGTAVLTLPDGMTAGTIYDLHDMRMTTGIFIDDGSSAGDIVLIWKRK